MAAVMQYDSNIFCYVHQYWHSAYMGAQNYFVSKLHTDYASRAIYIVSSLNLYNYFLISIYFGMWLQYRIHAVTLIEDFIPPKHGKTFVLQHSCGVSEHSCFLANPSHSRALMFLFEDRNLSEKLIIKKDLNSNLLKNVLCTDSSIYNKYFCSKMLLENSC